MTTITIDSKVVAAPTRMDPYAPGETTVFVPIDGNVITQVSNNRDTFGNKNALRSMSWDLLPETYDYPGGTDHTTGTLKALEGQTVTMDASDCYGYTTTQSINVVNVDIEWVVKVANVNWYTG